MAVRATAAARAAAVALPLPAFKRAPDPGPRPRPRPRPRPAPAIERSAPAGGLAGRLGRFVVSLPDHSWLDRVVRGRVWIPLLGVLLAGIVATQVEILKLGASMGRSLEQTSTLTTQNEQLQGSVAMLGDDQRIERLAGAMGLVLPPPGAVGYLTASATGNVAGALGNIHTPDSAAFVMIPAKNGAMITGPGTSTLPPSPGAPPPPAATTSTSAPTSSSAATSSSAGAATVTTTGTSPQTGTSSQTATSSQATTATSTQQPATTSQTTPATSQTQSTGTPQSTAPSNGTTDSGAAAIQPSDSSQQSGGG